VAFTKIEKEVLDSFYTTRRIGPEWDDSALRDLLPAAPSTKASFARHLVDRLAAAAEVEFKSVSGRSGGRRQIVNSVCEIKFSTEDPPRFQQVRLPDDGYDYLLGIGAHPKDFVYWLIPARDLQELIDEGELSYQHAETSLWCFPETVADDSFAAFRMREKALIAALAKLN
jgi:hypothetical protein